MDEQLRARLHELLSGYRPRMQAVMAGLADRPKAGAKKIAREEFTAHLREMHELAKEISRIQGNPILGS
jgi:hypothetical protein